MHGWDFVRWDWGPIGALRPAAVAVDMFNYMIRGMSVMMRPSRYCERVPTGHVHVALRLVTGLLRLGVTPVFVFDGPPDSLKRRPDATTVARGAALYRRFAASPDIYDTGLARTLHESPAVMTYFAAQHLLDLCSAAGVPTVRAPSEAEMAAAALCRDGLVGTAVSNDVDTLLFGAPHVSRHVHTSRGLVESTGLARLMSTTGLDLEGLRDLAVLCGCDFHPGIRGVGPRRGVRLLRRHGGLTGVLRALGVHSADRPAFLDARAVFESADELHYPGADTRLRAPHIPRLRRLLHAVYGTDRAEEHLTALVQSWKAPVQVRLEP